MLFSVLSAWLESAPNALKTPDEASVGVTSPRALNPAHQNPGMPVSLGL